MKGFFISSTFKDMQAERDVLHERVFPRLRQIIKAYGEDVQEVDLRWGVDTVNMTEEESGHEVLTVCIDAIDRCKPYIIVLLGERYGWIPGQQIVDAVDDTRISDRYENEMSITELEIQYGALLKEEAFERCVFCFRDPAVIEDIAEEHRGRYAAESEQHRQRLDALKRQIKARPGANILHYTARWDALNNSLCDLQDFEENLLSLLEKMIRQDFAHKKASSPPQQQKEEIHRMQQEHLSTYVRRYAEEYGILKRIGVFSWNTSFTQSEKPCDGVLLCGTAGQGKSALMAYAAQAVAQHKVKPILCFAEAAACRTVPLLKQYIAYRLEELCEVEHETDATSVEERLRALNDKVAGKQVVCFVDGLDQIYAGVEKPYIDLPTLCPHIFWVFSALPTFPFAAATAGSTFHTVPMGELTPAQREELITTTAKRRGKKLDDEITGMIVRRPGAANPLYLSLVLQRFFMMNQREFETAEALAPGMEGLHRYMQQLLTEMPDSPADIAAYILDVTAHLFDQQQFAETLMLLATSRNGLTEQELAALLQLEGISFSPIGFQRIVSYLYDAFGQKAGGKWGFRHRLFGEAIRASMTPADSHRIKGLLVQYSKANEAFLRQEGFYYIMEQRDEDTVRVLEQANTWDNQKEVLAHFARYVREEPAYQAFIMELVCRHPSEPLAQFFLSLNGWYYGEAVETLANTAAHHLLEMETMTATVRWQLAIRCLHTQKHPADRQAYLARAEHYAAALEEPIQRSIALAHVQAERAVLLKSTPDAHAAMDAALRYADQAEELLPACNDFQTIKSLLNALLPLTDIAGEQEEALTLRIRHLLERHSRFEQEPDYIHCLCRTDVMLCRLYSNRRFRDYDKAKLYGDRALELSEQAVSSHPTIQNLDLKAEALYAYCKRLKEAYAYPYLEQAMHCIRRCYATLNTANYKQELAYAECYYACAAGKAVNSRVKLYSDEEIAGYERVWDHGEQLYAELLADDPDSPAIYSYASFTADRAQVAYERGYLLKAIAHGEKSIALLEEICRRQGEAYRDWVENWLSIVKTTLAKAHLDRLELTQATACIDEAIPAAREQGRYNRLVDLTLLSAKARYYARDDSAALEACQQLDGLLDDPRAEKYANRDAYRWEELYIRARLALEAGDTALAYSLCEESRAYLPAGENTFAGNRYLTLLADCQSATGDPDAAKAWMRALQKWRYWQEGEQKRYEKDDKYRIFNRGSSVCRRAYRRESRHYAIASYYLAYCYYHCATTPDKHRELQQFGDQALFTVLAKTNTPSLEAIRPACIHVNGLEETARRMEERQQRQAAIAVTPFSSVDDLLNGLENDAQQDLQPAATVYSRLLHSREMLDIARLTGEQFERLLSLLKVASNRLMQERIEYKQARNSTGLLRQAFPLAETIPVFYCSNTTCIVWTAAYEQERTLLWRGYLRLTVLATQYAGTMDETQREKLLYEIMYALRGVADMDNKDLEKADLSPISDFELIRILQSCDPRFELFNFNGHQVINRICTEMYWRTRDDSYITNRLRTFEEWLSEPYNTLYKERKPDEKGGTAIVVKKAAHQLLKLLSDRGGLAWATRLVPWMQSQPSLAGQISSYTLAILEEYLRTEEGAKWGWEHRQWLEELKTGCYRKWLDGPLHWLKFC